MGWLLAVDPKIAALILRILPSESDSVKDRLSTKERNFAANLL